MSSPRFATSKAFLVVATAIGTLAACGGKPAAQQGMGAVPVTVVTLQPTTVTLTRELPGRTTPFLIAEVRPQVDGIVKQRLFTEGGSVKAGQPLYQIDDATYQADLRQRRGRARARRGDAAQRATSTRAAPTELVDDQRGQQAGRRERRGGAAAGARPTSPRRRPPRRARAHRPGLRAHHRADLRPHRQVDRSRRARWSPPTRQQPLATVAAARPDLRRPDAVERRAAASCARRSPPGALQSARDLPVTHPARGRHALRARRASSQFSEVTRRPGHRQLRAARRRARTPTHVLLPGMYVRARRRQRRARRTRSWCRSRASRATRSGNAIAMVVDADGKVEARAVTVEPARSATSGWSRTASPPATG